MSSLKPIEDPEILPHVEHPRWLFLALFWIPVSVGAIFILFFHENGWRQSPTWEGSFQQFHLEHWISLLLVSLQPLWFLLAYLFPPRTPNSEESQGGS